jgi:hypothetical protein
MFHNILRYIYTLCICYRLLFRLILFVDIFSLSLKQFFIALSLIRLVELFNAPV